MLANKECSDRLRRRRTHRVSSAIAPLETLGARAPFGQAQHNPLTTFVSALGIPLAARILNCSTKAKAKTPNEK
jgi:hypothetical protein